MELSSHHVVVGKKSSYRWVNRQGNTEHVSLSSHVTLRGAFLESTVLVASEDSGGGSEKSVPAVSPGEHLHSRERPKEPGLFISSETTLSGYLITALKYLSRERRSETR